MLESIVSSMFLLMYINSYNRSLHEELKRNTALIKKYMQDDFIKVTRMGLTKPEELERLLHPLLHGLSRINHVHATLAAYKEDAIKNIKETIKNVNDSCMKIINEKMKGEFSSNINPCR